MRPGWWQRRRRWLPHGIRVVLALLACIAGYYALPYDRQGASAVGTVILALGVTAMVILITRQIRSHLLYGGKETAVESLILALCLAVIAFALLYLHLAKQFDGLATKTDSLYFTVTTLATVGYGDIHPVGQFARIVVTIQMALDLIYVATLVTVVGGLVTERARTRREQADQSHSA